MIVADTSLIAHFFLMSGGKTDLARAVFEKDSRWASPMLWRSEFRNVLALYLRKDLLGLPDALEAMNKAERLLRGSEYHVSSVDVLTLAKSSGCTAYDCEYVALARKLSVLLVTTDQQVLQCFPHEAVSLESFEPA